MIVAMIGSPTVKDVYSQIQVIQETIRSMEQQVEGVPASARLHEQSRLLRLEHGSVFQIRFDMERVLTGARLFEGRDIEIWAGDSLRRVRLHMAQAEGFFQEALREIRYILQSESDSLAAQHLTRSRFALSTEDLLVEAQELHHETCREVQKARALPFDDAYLKQDKTLEDWTTLEAAATEARDRGVSAHRNEDYNSLLGAVMVLRTLKARAVQMGYQRGRKFAAWEAGQ